MAAVLYDVLAGSVTQRPPAASADYAQLLAVSPTISV
jgi:hypothetical protein